MRFVNRFVKTSLSKTFLKRVALFDKSADALFEHLRGRPWANRLFYTASAVGDYSLIWHLIAASAALFGGKRARRNLLRTSLVLGLESALVNGLLKSLSSRRRPPEANKPRPLYLRQPITSSFPSGHASSATVAAILLGEATLPAWRPLLRLVATVVALSRIHVRIHHASDVLGGASVGFLISQLAKHLWPLPR